MRIPEWFYKEHDTRNIEQIHSDPVEALAAIDEMANGLSSGWGEREFQECIKTRPHLLQGRYRDGHGTFAFFEQSLGGRFRIDCAVASGSSAGLLWELIEFETPQKAPFKLDGHLSEAARSGVEQIIDWRLWLQSNRDQAQKSASDDGLGLHDISYYSKGLVVVGRRSSYKGMPGRGRYDSKRREMQSSRHIEIISYDTFLESMRFYWKRRRDFTA